jgi:dienelactone hydrolase
MGVRRKRIESSKSDRDSPPTSRCPRPSYRVHGLVLAAAAVGVIACRTELKPPPLGSPRETMSDVDHGAAAAAVDAMDVLAADAQPDTEAHLRLTPTQLATANDSTRADILLVAMRGALLKYADVRVAAADGFEEMPDITGKHTMHHLFQWAWAQAESRRFDPTKPTSLVYSEAADGTLRLVGAMYTAPASATPAALSGRIPTSLARWHAHVDWCIPKQESGSRWLETKDGSAVYGPRSPVATREACDAAGGVFYPHVFGWMVHVTLVGSDDPAAVWSGKPASAPADSGIPTDTASRLAARLPPSVPPSVPLAIARSMPAATAARPANVNTLAALHRPPAAMLAARVAPAQSPVTQPAPAVAAPVATTVAMPTPTVFAAAGSNSGTYESGGTVVAYDRYLPATGGRHPAIVLLHDATGLQPQQANFRKIGTALAKDGYVIEVVHYFDRTGETASGAEGDRRAHFRQWASAIDDGLADLARVPAVDGDRLGILGTGLGATLALSVSAHQPHVKAVVDYSGMIPARAAALIQRMPAVLIAHGDRDQAVPIAEAYRIRAMCQAVGAPVELDVVPGQGHAIVGAGADELRRKSVVFFDRYLKTTQ